MGSSNADRCVRSFVKRGIDVLGAATGLAVAWPLFLAGSIAIRVSMGKPVLFRQLRPGLREQPFSIYKFRTMTPAAPRETWFRTDQQRLTLLGRFLRKASIDELPELLNVLKGEMSLVGPRPLLTEYLQKYTPREQRRHDVRPGITGWAQVNGRQNIPFSRRLELDVWYADNWSIALDVKILVLTLARGLRMTGVVSGQDLNDVDDIGLSADRERLTDPAKRKK